LLNKVTNFLLEKVRNAVKNFGKCPPKTKGQRQLAEQQAWVVFDRKYTRSEPTNGSS